MDKQFCCHKALTLAVKELNYYCLKLIIEKQFTDDNIQIAKNNAFDSFICHYSNIYHKNLNLDDQINQIEEKTINIEIDDPSLDTLRDILLIWIEDIQWSVIKWTN